LGGRGDAELALDGMFVFASGHSKELKEALSAGLPVYFAAITISVFLVVLAAIPPSALPASSLTEFVASRRRQLALVGGAILLSVGIVLAIVFWTL
jgi:hypothetical protein